MALQEPGSIKFFQKYFLLFCITLPAFHVLHRYNEYYRLLSFSQSSFYFLACAISFFLVFLGVKKILVQPGKAAWFTLELMIIFFFFGALRDGLKRTSFPAFLIAYRVFLPLVLITTVILFFRIKRKKIFQGKKLYFFNLLFLCFLIFELFQLTVNIILKKDALNDYKAAGSLSLEPVHIRDTARPDIYFIVFDEYTSSSCLKEEFGFDNSPLDSLLKAHHFFISEKSGGNYNITPFSVSSTLNLDYLDESLEGRKLTGKLLLQGIRTLSVSRLPVFLKQQGYSIKNYSLFDLQEYPAAHTAYFEFIRDEIVGTPTLAGNISRDIWWNVANAHFLTSAVKGTRFENTSKETHISNNMFNYNSLVKEISTADTAPKFVYCHLMLPHEPFYLDKNGQLLIASATGGKTDNKKLYLGQLEYANALISQVVPAISKSAVRPRVVIIEGDHGFRFYDELKNKTGIFKNLNAYYFSDGNYAGLYDSISPVNSFRVIVNKYFNQRLHLLPDKHVFINDSVNLILD
jgi:Sulfatase